MKKWMGKKPEKCQICQSTIGKVFYDARIPAYGRWGLICQNCFELFNCSLGLGKGQKYNSETLIKIGG